MSVFNKLPNIFVKKGKICVKDDSATRKVCGKKKLPAERGGREDQNTLIKK